MQNAILILVALLLGYGQGIKNKRKKEGKEGGVLRHFKEKVSRKWQLIREQDEEIFNLKEEIKELKRIQETQKEMVYTKGNAEDFQKEVFLFLWNSEGRIAKAILPSLFHKKRNTSF